MEALGDTAGTKIHQDSPGEVLCTKSIQIPSLSNIFKPNHPSFGVAECCHSSPECGGRGGVDCCMKTVPKRTRETSQRRSGDNTCRDIDVEVLCGPAGFHMFNCSNHRSNRVAPKCSSFKGCKVGALRGRNDPFPTLLDIISVYFRIGWNPLSDKKSSH